MRALNVGALVLGLLVSQFCLADSTFPKGPDEHLTPGTTCTHPDAYRYPEKIPYCNRNVDSDQKKQVIQDYNQLAGYKIDMKDRQQFKIDHYIPLCAGGSNESKNLWPQHQSIYQITDPLEPLICGKMAKGRLSQKQAIEYIFRAKKNLDQVTQVIAEVQAL